LAQALKKLSERNCENLLMYYFLEMSDTEIAKRQNISRSGGTKSRAESIDFHPFYGGKGACHLAGCNLRSRPFVFA